MKSSKNRLQSIKYYFFEERDEVLLNALEENKNSLASFRLFSSAAYDRKPFYSLITHLLSELNTLLI
jgi:hypothetical protein